MFYYSVWVRSSRYHGDDPLTYAYAKRLKTGQIVQIELQRELVLGAITGVTTKPRFKIKEITRVFDLPEIPSHLIRLSTWLKSYYPAPLGMITQQLLPVNLSEKQLKQSTKCDFPKPDLSKMPKLTTDQKSALSNMVERDTYILHGKTGSGKTRIYIELAVKSINDGRSAIILTPEISLTTQLANSFKQVFGERVFVMHSQQTPADRQKAWLSSLNSTEPVIVIGPRSALFSPVQKLGLIVLDEEHEGAYKQEQAPHYLAGRVGSYLAQITRSSLVLGSATPAIGDYYLAKQKNKPIIELKQLAQTNLVTDTKVSFVDRKDHSLFQRSPHLSTEMIKAVEHALNRGDQSLLYLNRRGTARMVMCSNCGWQATCPNCDVPLTYHGDKHELRCHSCNFHSKTPNNCPKCDHPEVIFKTPGTKAIVSEVERLFPKAKVARFDTDNLKAERFEQHYDSVKKGDIDILVGTQLLAKGLDLPRLSTLGVLLADTSLYMPDFSAQERTFQLISQVLGRIGRGHVAGTAVIQTYHPDHPVLKDAVEGNYAHFYETELKEREQYMFPPFCYLLKLSVRRASIKSAESAASNLKQEILESGYAVRVEGPAPCFYERFQNKFQWQLVVKSRNRTELLKIIKDLPSGWSYDIDPMDLL